MAGRLTGSYHCRQAPTHDPATTCNARDSFERRPGTHKIARDWSHESGAALHTP